MKLLTIITSLVVTLQLSATLELSHISTESTGGKSLVKLTIKNNFTQPIRAARAWVVLMDGEGKIVGQKATWIGNPNSKIKDSKLKINDGVNAQYQINLPEGEEIEASVVVDTTREVKDTKLTFSRIILADGTLVDPRKCLIAKTN